MDPKERIEYIEVLLKAGRYEEALPLYQEAYHFIVRHIIDTGLSRDFLLPIPGEPFMELYFGYSKHLNAYKIGISKDAQKRAKEIRANNARHNLGNDFELWDFAHGPAAVVREGERIVKAAYAHALTMGTEWISGVMEEAYDAYWVEKDKIFEAWEHNLRTFDPIAQLEREAQLMRLLGGPSSALAQINAIGRKIAEWDTHSTNMHTYFASKEQP